MRSIFLCFCRSLFRRIVRRTHIQASICLIQIKRSIHQLIICDIKIFARLLRRLNVLLQFRNKLIIVINLFRRIGPGCRFNSRNNRKINLILSNTGIILFQVNVAYDLAGLHQQLIGNICDNRSLFFSRFAQYRYGFHHVTAPILHL